MNVQQQEGSNTMMQQAYAALDDTPLFVDHISDLFRQSVDHLRLGNDLDGISAFARGMSDLGQLMELIQQVSAVTNTSASDFLDSLHQGFLVSMRELEESLKCQDIISLSDGIEANILPLMPHWSTVVQDIHNANDGVSLLQTAEGSLGEINELLGRMRELTVQAANGTLGTTERNSLHSEFVLLRSEIDRIADTTEFAGKKLINGMQAGGITFQVGIQNTSNDRITIALTDSGASAIDVTTSLSVSTLSKAQNAVANIDSAITNVTNMRGTIGATQNRLFVSINQISAMHENLSAANSRIRDADVASETASFTRNQILMQSGISVLAQANQLPSMALSLLG